MPLRGGGNLRFFFQSQRYSEDLDLDIHTVAKETLSKNVAKILSSTAFAQNLRLKVILLQHISAAKQTQTVQRWKIGIAAPEGSPSIHTKIEFSRRTLPAGVEFSPVDPLVTGQYRLPTILMSHYSREQAFVQKIEALIHRSATQARDVFDLNLLMGWPLHIKALPAEVKSSLPQAIARTESLTFADFKGQVLAYLPAELKDYYDAKDVWEKMVGNITAELEKFKS